MSQNPITAIATVGIDIGKNLERPLFLSSLPNLVSLLKRR